MRYYRVIKGTDEYYHIQYREVGSKDYKPYIEPSRGRNVSYGHRDLAEHDAKLLRNTGETGIATNEIWVHA